MAYKKMNPKHKKTWIKALESGNYHQGIGQLKHNTGGNNYKYCCLGVAERVCLEMHNSNINGETLSTYSKEKLKISDAAQNRLIELNDNKRLSFKEIAKWIRRNL